ncbi:MAG: D-alanine--D-alanine ligase [Bacteroidota bacterium]|nr:D-alanine--D-alanine ligase [Bacteroidota bacterium]
MKIKTGIFFGGSSKEREISFAGGRTVYDNLNKSLFEAVPVFIDSFDNFILLNWEFIYKGSIRDFYPPVDAIPFSKGDFQVYSESLGELTLDQQDELINKIGKRIPVEQLHNYMDFAFLALHGPSGEDGKIQGLLDYIGLPYSGSGILPSAIGIDKVIQKNMMGDAGFACPDFIVINRKDWLKSGSKSFFETAKSKIAFPLVVKSATQGSSIGVSIINSANELEFALAVNKSFFTHELSGSDWIKLNEADKIEFIRVLTDIREGIGIPLRIGDVLIYHPDDLIDYLNKNLSDLDSFLIESLDGEAEVIIEQFIEGKEFSCIVIQNEGEGKKAIALPPTEIRKGKELFDYRSKYLPGLSRKITPIDVPGEQINAIRKECEKLFLHFKFDVYARIDGFISNNKVFLNDPNTTSGMMPSSFFFHQAAEIGLNPSQFLTYIIRTSLLQRSTKGKYAFRGEKLLKKLDHNLNSADIDSDKKKIAVLLGGFSSERHISVESGRNIYEKLASSIKYQPIPVFLTGDENKHELYQIPVNVLLKDNADDIKEKIDHYSTHPVINSIIAECNTITNKYSTADSLAKPFQLDYTDLAKNADAVFIALHGRPGEDGAVQSELNKVGLPFNGSDVQSSQTTINKYLTNEILKQNGFLIAEHLLIEKANWENNPDKEIEKIASVINYPFIAKPVDDGCSSAVKKIKNINELKAFAKLIFRNTQDLDAQNAAILNIKLKEEFPIKNVFLIEELISKRDANHFLEITGGMLTKFDKNGGVVYEVFEASEALSEGEVLSLEEKFLAGQGQNITPARYASDPIERQRISEIVKERLGSAARILNVNGYCRIDAFVRVYNQEKVEVVFIEVNSLPGMTPATCIFHQCAINNYKPIDFIDRILEFSFEKRDLINQVK